MYGGSYHIRKTASRLFKELNNHISKTIAKRQLSDVAILKSWNIDEFREHAFIPQVPYRLPKSIDTVPAACQKWFRDVSTSSASTNSEAVICTTMNFSFWDQYADTVVPLEITSQSPQNEKLVQFEKIEAPMSVLLGHIDGRSSQETSIYLAQHDLRDLPAPLQDDLPTPGLVKLAGKGDIYSSSLWLGKTPTYTPLHRDPNPNLFTQLAGMKAIRLFHPDIGTAIFDHVRQTLVERPGGMIGPGSRASNSPSFRGEEMMQGLERALLHDLVWADLSSKSYHQGIMDHAHQAVVAPGQALFIPKGWWHSVKSVGQGVTASANWWFR